MAQPSKKQEAFLISILITLVLATSIISVVHALGVIDTVPLRISGGYYGAAYDSDKGEIFITNADYGSVSVISDSTNTAVENILVGSLPLGVVYDSGVGEVFVANYASDSVSVISDQTNTVVAKIAVGANPLP